MTPLKTMADECAWLLGEAGAQPSNAPLATVIAKSLIMAAVLSQGVPLLTQVRPMLGRGDRASVKVQGAQLHR